MLFGKLVSFLKGYDKLRLINVFLGHYVCSQGLQNLRHGHVWKLVMLLPEGWIAEMSTYLMGVTLAWSSPMLSALGTVPGTKVCLINKPEGEDYPHEECCASEIMSNFL